MCWRPLPVARTAQRLISVAFQALVETLRWVVEYVPQPQATRSFVMACKTLAALAAGDAHALAELQPGGAYEWGALRRLLLRGQPKRPAALLGRGLDAVTAIVGGPAAGASGGGGSGGAAAAAAAAGAGSTPSGQQAELAAAEAAMKALLKVRMFAAAHVELERCAAPSKACLHRGCPGCLSGCCAAAQLPPLTMQLLPPKVSNFLSLVIDIPVLAATGLIPVQLPAAGGGRRS